MLLLCGTEGAGLRPTGEPGSPDRPRQTGGAALLEHCAGAPGGLVVLDLDDQATIARVTGGGQVLAAVGRYLWRRRDLVASRRREFVLLLPEEHPGAQQQRYAARQIHSRPLPRCPWRIQVTASLG